MAKTSTRHAAQKPIRPAGRRPVPWLGAAAISVVLLVGVAAAVIANVGHSAGGAPSGGPFGVTLVAYQGDELLGGRRVDLGTVVGHGKPVVLNFFAGLWVLVERPFRIGDTIDVSGYTGVVEEISFRTTQLRTPDGRQVIVPNGDFMTKPIVNLTRFPLRRAIALLTLDATSELSADAVREALASVNAVAREPEPTVELHRVANGRARYQVTFWTPDHDAGLAATVAALRTHFPDAEVRAA